MLSRKVTRRDFNRAAATAAATGVMPQPLVKAAGSVMNVAATPAALVQAAADPVSLIEKAVALTRQHQALWQKNYAVSNRLELEADGLMESGTRADMARLGQTLDEVARGTGDYLRKLIELKQSEAGLADESVMSQLWTRGTPHPQNPDVHSFNAGNLAVDLIREDGKTTIYCFPDDLGSFSLDGDATGAFISDAVCDLIGHKPGRRELYKVAHGMSGTPLGDTLMELLNSGDAGLPSAPAKELLAQHEDYTGTIGQMRKRVRPEWESKLRQLRSRFRRGDGKENRPEPPELTRQWQEATGLEWQAHREGEETFYIAEIRPGRTARRLMWGEVPLYNTARAVAESVTRLELEEGESAALRPRIEPLAQESGSPAGLRIVLPARIFNRPAYPARAAEDLKSRPFSDRWKEEAYRQAAAVRWPGR